MSECRHLFGRSGDCKFCSKSATQLDGELKKTRSNAGAFERALKVAVDAGDEAARKEYSNPLWGSAGTFSGVVASESPMLQSLIDAQTRMNGMALKAFERYADAVAKSLVKAPPQPSQSTCDWCNETTFFGCTRTTCIACADALAERLYAGANDCQEERDSVRRWVDRQRVTKACRGCTRPLEQDAHVLFCSDCAVSKPERVAVVTEEPSGWSAWATATDES
jgi:hypothetical protein